MREVARKQTQKLRQDQEGGGRRIVADALVLNHGAGGGRAGCRSLASSTGKAGKGEGWGVSVKAENDWTCLDTHPDLAALLLPPPLAAPLPPAALLP